MGRGLQVRTLTIMDTLLTSQSRTQMRLPLRFLVGVLLTLALALGFFYWLMRPSMFELQAMGLFLAITSGVSVLAGYVAYRSGWIQRSPHLSWTIVGSYALASVLTFLNVWMTARLMFASAHDLQLATVLLLFAGGIAMSWGYFFSAALNDSIAELNAGASAIARGELAARVPVRGANEMAELAHTFNEMAGRLQERRPPTAGTGDDAAQSHRLGRARPAHAVGFDSGHGGGPGRWRGRRS